MLLRRALMLGPEDRIVKCPNPKCATLSVVTADRDASELLPMLQSWPPAVISSPFPPHRCDSHHDQWCGAWRLLPAEDITCAYCSKAFCGECLLPWGEHHKNKATGAPLSCADAKRIKEQEEDAAALEKSAAAGTVSGGQS